MKRRANPAGDKPGAEAVTLSVRIQPRASKNEILRMEGGGVKIRLTAPPVDGAANDALIKFLADTFGITKAQVEIISGHTSKNKIVRIEGISREQADQVLNQAEK